MNNRVTPRTLATLAFTLGLPMALTGCDNPNIPAAGQTAEADDHDHAGHDHADDGHRKTAADRTPDYYTDIRGVVKSLPTEDNPMLEIHHEQIRDFKTEDGEVNVSPDGISGMRAMAMPFPVADDVSLEEIKVGDKIAFDFVVKWGQASGPAWELTRIERLDAGTVINFENEIEEDLEQAAEKALGEAEEAADDQSP